LRVWIFEGLHQGVTSHQWAQSREGINDVGTLIPHCLVAQAELVDLQLLEVATDSSSTSFGQPFGELRLAAAEVKAEFVVSGVQRLLVCVRESVSEG